MKKLKLTDILLLSIGGILDIFQEIKDPGGIYSKYYENFYGFVPDRWKRQNYYSIVSKLLEQNKIHRIKKGTSHSYDITSKGLLHLQKRRLLNILQGKKWDKKWRILIFDIEEINKNLRNNLRDTIKEFGFGYLQKSVWISPYDVFKKLEEFIQMRKLQNNIILIESKKLSIPNQELASIVWQIDKVKSNYNQIYKDLYNISIKRKLKKYKDLKPEFNKIYKQLISTILKDPHLPKEFLSHKWPYQKTVSLAKKLRHYFIKKN